MCHDGSFARVFSVGIDCLNAINIRVVPATKRNKAPAAGNQLVELLSL
jgi:hypothetical protein